ncbi:Histone acetyltransferase [Fulvia fulva]|uniref:histone acetyltransferase n=1 Tax=Passalora fulva TaxID=5499 RepID=A0A9Q8LJ51_PASFU|nr:Histone acetyltransferase [Fulvia fulva]KAK4622232.1 Histone acetyltransferase [Fulvia fulva]KAK4623457.1 Histone acetyltransferase [Fulvia fulva]UJO18454.1 Histone acetyltransferase [Fulvia fulva]WPV15836.1 Histone acetyltransferase [Fulvia fulva]WPV30692.1 Histone acetyltransferase [Fulvia fulva]
MTLKDDLKAALPTGFNANVRYVRSRPKACEPLFSALPGQQAEKTRVAGHFLAVSISPDSEATSTTNATSQQPRDVISFAIEVSVYTTKQLTTIFISKVDSTAHTSKVKPSPVKTTVTTLLQYLANKELRRHPRRKVVISLFARAQAQYLFPGSADSKTKHVLDDRQLIKWWARVLDPIIPRSGTSTDVTNICTIANGVTNENSSNQPVEPDVRYQGYLTVPGFAKNELRSFMPTPATTSPDTTPRWKPEHPLMDLARTRGLPEHAPPRCLLPRFEDDPKARYMTDLDEEIGIAHDAEVTISPSKRKSGRWNSVRSLDQFWEMMAFRQECSSGRAVGFLWLVISPEGSDAHGLGESQGGSQMTDFNSQETVFSQESLPPTNDLQPTSDPSVPLCSSPKKKRRKPLTGPVIPRQPRLKKADSSTLSHASVQDGEGLAVSKDGYDKVIHTLLQLDFANLDISVQSTSKWVKEVIGISGSGDFSFRVEGTANATTLVGAGQGNGNTVNDLGGMIRKKRKANDVAPAEAQQEAVPAVNVLSTNMVRKKPKAAVP